MRRGWLQVRWKMATMENSTAPVLFQEDYRAVIIWKRQVGFTLCRLNNKQRRSDVSVSKHYCLSEHLTLHQVILAILNISFQQ